MVPQTSAAKKEMVYPESDGKPMADNTKQFRWIVTVQGGLDALFVHREHERAARLRALGVEPQDG